MRFPRSPYVLALLIGLVVWLRLWISFDGHFPHARPITFFDAPGAEGRIVDPAPKCEGAGVVDGVAWYRICGALHRFDLTSGEAHALVGAPAAARGLVAFSKDPAGLPVVAFERSSPGIYRIGANVEPLGAVDGALIGLAAIGDTVEAVTSSGVHTRAADGSWSRRALPPPPSSLHFLQAVDRRNGRLRFWYVFLPEQYVVPKELVITSVVEGDPVPTYDRITLATRDGDTEALDPEVDLLEPTSGNVLPREVRAAPWSLVFDGARFVQRTRPDDALFAWRDAQQFHGDHADGTLHAIVQHSRPDAVRIRGRWLAMTGGYDSREIVDGASHHQGPSFARGPYFDLGWLILPAPDGGLFLLGSGSTTYLRLDASFARADAPSVRDRIVRMFVRPRAEPLMPLRKALLPVAALAPFAIVVALFRTSLRGAPRRGLLVLLAMLVVAWAVWPIVAAF